MLVSQIEQRLHSIILQILQEQKKQIPMQNFNL